MKATPGGILPIEEIFGRDAFIERLWSALERNSIRMEAERRIGKTCVLRKMNEEPLQGWEAIFLDLEKVHSAAEFAELVCIEVQARLTFWKRQGSRLSNFLQSLGGTEVGGFKLPERKHQPDGYWKNLLTYTIEDLVEQQAHAGRRVVFFFDEMPWMLSAIGDAERDGPTTAMEVLDVLRALRQSPATGPGFRMILCGSIGLHHVLGELADKGYRNQPLNDMMLVEVPPLDPDSATQLAAALIAGEGLAGDADAAAHIAERTGGFAYYIHWIVNALKLDGRAATSSETDEVIRQMLTAAHDPCDLRHFLTRIDKYYLHDKQTALALLDHAAMASAPLGVAELVNVAKSVGASDDNRIRELLRLLAVDHYLHRDTEGRYVFRHVLLREWWVAERGIA